MQVHSAAGGAPEARPRQSRAENAIRRHHRQADHPQHDQPRLLQPGRQPPHSLSFDDVARIEAVDAYIPYNDNNLPTGEIAPVPARIRLPSPLTPIGGNRIPNRGYDHTFRAARARTQSTVCGSRRSLQRTHPSDVHHRARCTPLRPALHWISAQTRRSSSSSGCAEYASGRPSRTRCANSPAPSHDRGLLSGDTALS